MAQRSTGTISHSHNSTGDFVLNICYCPGILTLFNHLKSRALILTFRHRASCILGQAFRYSPENAFYIFNQVYFII